jgi:hypothetical protein
MTNTMAAQANSQSAIARAWDDGGAGTGGESSAAAAEASL